MRYFPELRIVVSMLNPHKGELTAKKQIFVLRRQIKDAFIDDDYESMRRLNDELPSLTFKLTDLAFTRAVNAYHQNVTKILTQKHLYTTFFAQIAEFFRPPKKPPKSDREEQELKLDILEEQFQNALADDDYTSCLKLVREILKVAEELGRQDRVAVYRELPETFAFMTGQTAGAQEEDQFEFASGPIAEPREKAPIETAAQGFARPPEEEDEFIFIGEPTGPSKEAGAGKVQVPEGDVSEGEEIIRVSPRPLDPDLRERIAQLKSQAVDLESELEFDDARAVYHKIEDLIKDIDDPFTRLLCDQKIAQIASWEEETAKSDFSKWDIPPFRLINRTRFDCLVAISNESVARQKMESLITLGVGRENIIVFTIHSEKFKGIAPYNQDGECYAIYLKRMLDSDMFVNNN